MLTITYSDMIIDLVISLVFLLNPFMQWLQTDEYLDKIVFY
jgi:hypothetical protein